MTTNLKRANRVTVQKSKNNEGFIAKMHKTHKLVAEIDSTQTTWKPMTGLNATANRELFRVWITENAQEYGVQWDPNDRRNERNQFPAKYDSDDLLIQTAIRLIESDIKGWAEKCGVIMVEMATEGITEVTKSARGKDVSPKYNNGNWAWASVQLVVGCQHTDVQTETVTIGYVTLDVQLVSGQLKKPSHIGDGGYNYTGFRTELAKDIPAIAEVKKEESKEENKTTEKKSKKTKSEKK